MKSCRRLFTAIVAVGMVVCCQAEGEAKRQPVPAGVGIWEGVQFPDAETDIMGVRLCLPYGRQARMSGLDIGVLGCSVDGCLFGLQACGVMNSVGMSNGALQIGGVANNCEEDLYGVQMSGIANTTADGVYGGQVSALNFAKNVGGLQIGVFSKGDSVYGGQLSALNFAQNLGGIQIGVFNKGDQTVGIQIGVINLATEMEGVQLGVLNVIEKGTLPWLPLLNWNL